ncbi:MAG: orotate phosphoribosyltransferase [Gemmatimonadales bacterium]|nr:orotate phosphoribosyltransferase [Gemmatimonadales bacterium]
MNDLQALESLLLARSLAFGDFTLSSGQRSSYYIDARKTTMSAEGLDLIGRLGLGLIRERGWAPRSVGGLTMGADPVAYAIALASRGQGPAVDGFSVRKATKDHGTKRRVEGNFEAGDSVVIVEDVLTSGGSAIQAVEAVQAEGGTVLGVVAVVDREQGGRQAIELKGLEVAAITTISRLGIDPASGQRIG